jgi:hypothetical protein
MNWDFKGYLKSIRPAKNGIVAILFLTVCLPLLVDIFLLTVPSADLKFSLTRFIVSSLPAGLFALGVWLLGYFILTETYYSFKSFLKQNMNDSEPGS